MIRKRALTIPFFTVFSILTLHVHASSSLIVGYISPAPAEVLQSLTIEKVEKPIVGGIKMNYFGYSDYTNSDGYFSFPKTHTGNELRIIVCQSTDYELLKNTVSQVRIKKSETPTIAVYRITKQQEVLANLNAPGASTAPQPEKIPTPAAETEKDKDATKSGQPGTWYFKVESLGTSVPEDGLKPQDLVIFCNPKDLYIYTGSEKTTPPNCAVHYAEENNNFILPTCVYLLKSQPMADITTDDKLTQLVDVEFVTNSVPTKSTETDSLGNPLPGIEQSTIAGAVD